MTIITLSVVSKKSEQFFVHREGGFPREDIIFFSLAMKSQSLVLTCTQI